MKVSFIKLVLCCILFSAFLFSMGQTKTKLSVVDILTKKGIEKASVKLISSDQKIITGLTDGSGEFIWSAPNQRWIRIEVTHLAYETLYFIVKEGTEIPDPIELSPKNNLINEVEIVNTGYQRLSKERSTGSFSMIKSDDLMQYSDRNALSNLDKLTSGIVFDKRFEENDGNTISIRGRGTIFGGTAPLIILDDFPYEGRIDDIDPAIIKSITILKDAAAASIWGARASNGVLVITTKNGKGLRKTQIFTSSSFRIKNKPDLQELNWISTIDFIEVEKFLFSNNFYDNQEISPTKMVLSPVVEALISKREGKISDLQLGKIISKYSTYDIRKDMERYLYKSEFGFQNTVQIANSNGINSQSLQLGWDQQQSHTGLISNRYTINTTNNFLLWNKLQLDLRLNYTLNKMNAGGLNYSDLTSGGSKRIYPYARLVDDQYNNAVVLKDYRDQFLDESYQNGLLDWRYRPLDENQLINDKSNRHQGLSNLTLRYPIFKGLNIETKYQASLYNQTRLNLKNKDSYYVRDLVNRFTQESTNGELSYPVPYADVRNKSIQTSYAHYFRTQVNYNFKSVNHELDVMGGYEKRISDASNESSTIYGFNNNDLTFAILDHNALYPMYYNKSFRYRIDNGLSLNATSDRFVSYYANMGYTFKNKYTLSASARKDGSNIFGVNTNQKFIPLWSIGGAYNLTNEPFLAIDIIKYLKVRLSYGFNGHVDNSMSSLPTMRYTNGQTFYPNLNYAILVNPYNPDLRWEKTGTINVGVDFKLSGGVSGSVDLYQKDGTDIIGDTPLDPTLGIMGLGLSYGSYAYRGNIAEMRNRGLDISLNTVNPIDKLIWSNTLNISYNANEVRSYQQKNNLNGSFFVGTGMKVNPIVGKPIYSIYSYSFQGLDEFGDPQGWQEGQINKDYSKILTSTNVDELIYHGPAVAPWYGNYRTRFSYGPMSISAAIAFKFGFYFRRESINYNDLYQDWRGHSDFEKRWQKPGDELKTSVPAMIYPNINNRDLFYSNSSVLVERGDYIRLSDIRYEYNLLKGSIKCFAMVENLGFVYKKTNARVNPETLSDLSLPRMYTLGFSLRY